MNDELRRMAVQAGLPMLDDQLEAFARLVAEDVINHFQEEGPEGLLDDAVEFIREKYGVKP